MHQPKIAITMGDAAGIGPEIVAKFMADRAPADVLVIGDVGVMTRALAMWAPDRRCVQVTDMQAVRGLKAGDVPVLAVSSLPADVAAGQIDARAGRAAYDAIVRAIDLAIAGEIGGMVTAPIHKEALRAAGIPFPGHTEILAECTGTTDFGMMLVNDSLRVVLVSIHVPLSEAIRRVTPDAVRRTIRLAHEGVQAFGIERPRIAVAGLNPHAGEGGLFGREDLDIIAPAVADMAAQGYRVSGPYAADTVFMRARTGEFDVVVAQYHDQGLIPVKYLGLDEGVNVTVGLPIIRTSVDHGTAFDIAWQGRASPLSLKAAYACARQLIAARQNSGQGQAR